MIELNLEKERAIRKAMMDNDMVYIKEVFGDNQELLNFETSLGTWLNIAVGFEREEIVQYLISLGVDLNYGGIDGATPLNTAVAVERIDIVKMLLENGARIDTSNISQNPLITAINQKNLEIVRYLLDQNIDITVKYNLNYGEVDVLKYAKIWSTPEIVSLIEKEFLDRGIPLSESEKKSEKNLDKRTLKKKFDFALRQMVREWRGNYWGKEEIYAMCFHIDYGNTDIKKRFMCEVMIQTKKGCEEHSSEGRLDFKYIPKEYKYIQNGLNGFQRVQEYLYENCISLEECEALKNLDEKEKIYENIRKQTLEIEKILVETIAKLRREKFLTSDYYNKQFYVFPYVGENDIPKNYIPLAKKMNEGLYLTEYIKYMGKNKFTDLEILMPEPEENILTSKNRKIDNRVLKKKFEAAIRQMVEVCLEKYGEEELYAMCFRMHYDSADIKGRFLCEIIVQTEKSYEETVKKCIEEIERTGEECRDESLLYYKYIPEEYKYAQIGLDGFWKVHEYLYNNCLDLEECEELEDFDEKDKMYEKIAKQALEIEKILADVIAKLRQEKFLTNRDGREFYIFPYIDEDALPKNYIPLAKKMNKGLDLTEYLKFIETDFME